ncbi:MAG: KH domain-containing protein [Actinobacteria bacterium]|nr:KH domain-containing protein [Actinomycetota bacterium]
MVGELARGLVDSPRDVRVEVEDDGDGVVLSLYVAQEDLGQVIGRGGRIARSLRLLRRRAAQQRGGGFHWRSWTELRVRRGG